MTPTYKNILILCGISFVLCLLSIQSGHNWGGDFSIILAPFYYLFGENFVLLKAMNALFFVGSIPLVFTILRSVSNRKDLAWYASILFAINYQLIFLSDSLGSDFMGMFLGFLALSLMLRIRDFDHWMNAVFLGLTIFLCYVTRTVGLVLVPSLMVFHLCQYMKLKRVKALNVVLPYMVFAGCYLMYGQLFESFDSKYLVLIDNINLQSIGTNIIAYGAYLMEFFVSLHFFPAIVSIAGALVFFPIFIFGIWSLIRRDNLFLMCYCATMLLLFIIYPFTSFRFIIPLSAFVFYAVLNGMNQLNKRFLENIELTKWASVALIVAGLLQSLIVIGIHIKDGTNDSLTLEMQSIYAYINDQISDEKIFVFHKPRVLRLYTENNGFMLTDFSSNKVNQADHLLVPIDQGNIKGFEVQKTWESYQLMKKIK